MVEVVLYIALWAALLGFIAFCLLYAILASPWQDHMGRHILFFMLGLTIAFLYGAFSRYLEPIPRTKGWTVILIIIAGLVWWRVVILLKFQIRARQNKIQ
jgi:hypothetical protein